MIKVLLADDARLVRLLLREMLARDPEIVVVGEAANGREAVDLTRKLAPDLVIMDVVMPVMDGLAAVREIMATCPTPILVLSATCGQAEGKVPFQAVRMGALDVMAKPEGGLQASEEFAGPLLEKVRLLSGVRVMHHFGGRPRRAAAPLPRLVGGTRSLVAIGASTGGPRALLTLLQKLPVESGARVLVVQHIAKGFAPGFARWLDQECSFSVRLARSGDQPEPGVVLVAPADQHMELRGGRVLLTSAPPVNSCRPSVDVLFRSLADEGAASVVGVLLTGMGQDGAAGMLALKQSGGYNIVQDEATSAVFGMPGAALARGAAHRALPLERIPAAIAVLLGQNGAAGQANP